LKNEKKKEVYQRVRKATVRIEGEELKHLLFLSRTLMHLWNLALDEAESWLENATTLKNAWWIASFCQEEIEIPIGSRMTWWKLIQRLLRLERLVTAYGFNYWLTPMRRSTILLEDQTPVNLDDVSSDLQRKVLVKLAGSYQSFFELQKKNDFKARKPQKKTENDFLALSWSTFKINNGKLIVPGYQRKSIEISLKNRLRRNDFSGGYLESEISGKKVDFITLSRNIRREYKPGEYDLSLVLSETLPELIERPVIFRAIDLGAGDIAVMDWDESQRIGIKHLIPARRPDKMWMEKIALVEARQEKRVKGSRGWKRLAAARKYMHARSGEQKSKHQEKVANALVPANRDIHCIIVGKPKTRLGLARTKTGTPKQHYGAQNTGYLFRQFLYLRNKAEERDIRFIELPDPRREGELDDPESKFRATLKLLQDGYRTLGRQGAPDAEMQMTSKLADLKIDFGG
jgi:hypothetical protein